MRQIIILISKNKNIILFILVILISAFFLFWKIDSVPYGLNNDASWEGSAAIEILKGNYDYYIPYAAEGWRGEGIVRVIVSFFMIFFGYDPITIRLSTVFFGLGLVIATFFLIRKLFDDKIALLTSFFIAISGWQITFSKTGWRAVAVPFFTTLSFYFYFKGIESKKYFHFILAGIFLSVVTFYTYDAARAVPILFIIWLIIEIFTKKSFIKIYYKHLFVLLFSALIVSLPMLFYAINNYDNFTNRSDYLFIGHQIEQTGNYIPLVDNIKTSFLLFNISANGNDFFIFEPLVDSPVSWLFPIGIAISIILMIKNRDKRYLFMLIWFLVSLIPGILSVPNGNRAIGAIPSVYFFSAVGLLIPFLYVYEKFNRVRIKYLIFSFIIIFCTVSIFATYDNYLGKNRRELRGFYPETLITTNYIKTVWDDNDIYITGRFPRELLTFYLYRDGSNAFNKNYTWLESNQTFLNINQNNEKGLVFIMFYTVENEIVAEELVRKYPKSNKFILWYDNDNIHRPAALVVMVNPIN